LRSGPNATSRWFHWRGHAAALVILPVWFAVLFSRPVIPGGFLIDLLLQGIGWLLFLAGIDLRLWATLYVGGRKGNTIVTDGPYSLCRNPLYIGSFLIGFSAVFFFKSLTLAAGLGLATLIYTATAVLAEERYLRDRHGETYLEYCRRVPRFLPRPGSFRSEPSIQVKVKHLRHEVRRAVLWLWLPLVCQGCAFLRVQPWWPAPFRLP
jgi:protein-S-isoprenylcysteine O-methyltransferase Ste14